MTDELNWSALLGTTKAVKTNKNSHIVWQLVHEPTGLHFTGPGELHEGLAISGPIGWRTKRDAVKALEELREIARRRESETLNAIGGNTND